MEEKNLPGAFLSGSRVMVGAGGLETAVGGGDCVEVGESGAEEQAGRKLNKVRSARKVILVMGVRPKCHLGRL